MEPENETGPDSRATWSARVRSGTFTGSTLLAFASMDLTFKCLVLPAYYDLVSPQALPGASSPLGFVLAATVLTTALWLEVMRRLTRRVDAWQRAVRSEAFSDAEIRHAGSELHRLPEWMSLAWAAQWVGLLSLLFVWGSPPSSWLSAGFFLTAMALGPPPLAHSLATWLLAPTVRSHSLIARARGIGLPTRLISLTRRLALYNLCVALAPMCYMAAAGFSALTQQVSVAHLLTTTLLFSAGVAVFALLCAALLSSTVTGPVAEMSSVLRTITRQGDVSKVGHIPQFEADEMGALAELANQMIDRLEIATLEKAAATESLAALNRELELRVERRTAELRARAADMRLVLDNVNEGLFTIDRSAAIASEYSATLRDWFGDPEPGQAFHQYWLRQSADFGLQTQLAWEQVVDGELPLELTLDQMPQRLVHSSRQYDVSYKAIGEGEGGRCLVVVSDRTADLEHHSAQRERRETLVLFEHLLADRSGLVSFMREASQIVSQILTLAQRDLSEAKRAIHTLKGNALLFGLESVSDICHDIESLMTEEQSLPDARQLNLLSLRWARLEADVGGLLGERREMIEMSPQQYAELELAARQGMPHEMLVGLLQALRLEPVEVRLRQLAEQARQLAQRLEKQVHVTIVQDGLRLEPIRWSRFWSALVHAVRNAVDHGIEPPSVRSGAGKPEVAHIELRAEQKATQLVFEVKDDGCGVRWEDVRALCLSNGLPAATEQDLISALFRDGVSTALQASVISGRGIGMGALRAAVEELDGKLEVLSQPQLGTRLRMTFPVATAAPGYEAQRLAPERAPSLVAQLRY